MSDKTALGISEELRQFIEALVEEVVFEGKPFENQKKYLQRFCEAEGVNYDTLECNLNDLFEALKELEEHESRVIEQSIWTLAKYCYLYEIETNRLIENVVEVRSSKGDSTYIDLGLPSGTKWKISNETYPKRRYTYDDAIQRFGNKLPSSEQFYELMNFCKWDWDEEQEGYNVEGLNGNSIFIPADGWCDENGKVVYEFGNQYWSSTPDERGYDQAWSFYFDSHCSEFELNDWHFKFSVRLIKHCNHNNQ